MNAGMYASSQGGLLRVLIEQADFFFRLAHGDVPGAVGFNKFGRNAQVDTGTVPEDVWSAGDIWVPPTTARIHNLTSLSGNDTLLGSGAQTVEVTGLVAWDQHSVTEVVDMAGASNAPTSNAYVIIYRMEALTFGALGTNDDIISATAVTDATVTAEISAGAGQTEMAIFAVPKGQSVQLLSYYLGWSRSGQAANSADTSLLVNLRPDQSDGGYVVKHHLGLFGSGNTYLRHDFRPYFVVEGPAIIKVQVEDVSASNTDLSAGFDGIVVTT